MDLSIIIPCHNLEKYISNLLESLSEQIFDKYSVELIFICDSCEDLTQEIIYNWADTVIQYSLIHVLQTDVHSVGLARNIGIQNSTGKYIMFLDGDDWLNCNNGILYLLNYIEQNPGIPFLSFNYTYPPTFSAVGHYSMVWQYLFRRETIEKIQFTNISPHEDCEFMQKVLKLYHPWHVNICIYHYNFLRPNSIIWTYRNEQNH